MMAEKNIQRREERIERENLLREYGGREQEINVDLKKEQMELGDLQNKIRFGEASIGEEEQRLQGLTVQVKKIEEQLKRERFELRQNKDKEQKLAKSVEMRNRELTEVKKALKRVSIQGR